MRRTLKSTHIRMLSLALAAALLCQCVGCGQKAEKRSAGAIIEEMVVDYGS